MVLVQKKFPDGGEAMVMFEPDFAKFPPELLARHPTALKTSVDTSGMKSGPNAYGKGFYAEWLKHMNDNNLIQGSVTHSNANKVRKPQAVSNAYLRGELKDPTRVAWDEDLNLYDQVSAPVSKAFLPHTMKNNYTPSEMATMDVEDQMEHILRQQLMATEHGLREWLPSHSDRLIDNTRPMPRDTGALTQFNVNKSLLKQAEVELAERAKRVPGYETTYTPQTLAEDMRAGEFGAAIGQGTIDRSKLFMDSLTVPESQYPQLVEDYLRQLASRDQAKPLTYRPTSDAPSLLQRANYTRPLNTTE
jgi:hypothetical protein